MRPTLITGQCWQPAEILTIILWLPPDIYASRLSISRSLGSTFGSSELYWLTAWTNEAKEPSHRRRTDKNTKVHIWSRHYYRSLNNPIPSTPKTRRCTTLWNIKLNNIWKQFWKSVNVWWRYGQKSVWFFYSQCMRSYSGTLYKWTGHSLCSTTGRCRDGYCLLSQQKICLMHCKESRDGRQVPIANCPSNEPYRT